MGSGVGLTEIKGAPDAIPVPRSIVSKMLPSAAVGAVIVMFVLISRVEFKTIFALFEVVAPATVSAVKPIVAEARRLLFASSTDFRRVQAALSDGMSSFSEVTQ